MLTVSAAGEATADEHITLDLRCARSTDKTDQADWHAEEHNLHCPGMSC